VTVRVVEVDPSSEQADEAKQFGIDTRDIQYELEGTSRIDKVVMGAVVNSGANEVVIPHFGQGTPIEYELTRAIQTVATEKRKTIGLLETDLKIGGGFDMSSFRQSPECRIVAELKKSYTVENVSPAAPIDRSKYDVLVAFLPSSLGMNELTNLVNYTRLGKPVLILDDPLPLMNLGLAPRLPKPRPNSNPMMSMGMPPTEKKAFDGRATSLVDLLNIEWIYDEMVWDETSLYLHPEYEKLLREEYLSVSRQSGNPDAFDKKSPVTKSLQEVMLFFCGSIKERELKKGAEKTLDFEPLLLTGKRSGILKWDDLVKSQMFGGIAIDPNPIRTVDGVAHILAARITSTKDAKKAKDDKDGKGDEVNAIYIADTDLVSDFLVDLRETKRFRLDLDNITFFLNAIDQLAGDMATIDLRNRRPQHRTLATIERQTAVFVEEANQVRKDAAEEAKEAMNKAKKRFDEKVESIKNDESLDEETKFQKVLIAQKEGQRRLEVEETGINQERDKKIEASKSKAEQKSRQVKDRYYTLALVAAPIPAIMLGLIVLLIRISNEQKDITPARRVGHRAA
jgi:ABC-2 type transport system permease protein